MFRPVLAGALSLAAAGALLAALPTPTEAAHPAAEAQTYTIDEVHSSIVFHLTHLGVSDAWGRFNDFSGSFTYDPEHPENMTVSVEVQADSVDTDNAKRDEHLRSADFFNAKQFPTLKFESKSLEQQADGEYTLTGDMTMLGKTRPVEAGLRIVGRADTQMGKKMGATATFTVTREDFGMTNYLEMVGNDVHVTVALEGDLAE